MDKRTYWMIVPVAATLLVAGCLEAPSAGSTASMEAPEWAPGDAWTYQVTDGEHTWQVAFEVAGKEVANGQEVWVVHKTTSARPWAGEREASTSTEYYAVDTLNPVWDWCGDPVASESPGACAGTERWFGFPLEDGEAWTWQRGGDVVTRVRSTAEVTDDRATLRHDWLGSDFRATHTFERGEPFYTEHVLEGPGGQKEMWTLMETKAA